VSFKDGFYGNLPFPSGPNRVSYSEAALINTTDRGLTEISQRIKVDSAIARQSEQSSREQFQSFQSALIEQGEMHRQSNEQNARILAEEFSLQIGQLNDSLGDGLRDISMDVRAASEETVASIERLGRYLGAALSEVRWAVEKNTSVTQKLLEVQLNSHWNDSRQFYEAGVHWYEKRKLDLSRLDFQKAVAACSTNAFAYQYLGFLAVHRDDQREAVQDFELATECAPSDHHRAIAHYHLARALDASGDPAGSLEHAQAAVELERGNLVFRNELVHALVRTGAEDRAILELRNLISDDMNYWIVSDIDRSLDPIRSKVNTLRDKMREERKESARVAMSRFDEAIRVTTGYLDPALAKLTETAEAKYKALQTLYDHGTVFDYQNVERLAPEAVDELAQAAGWVYGNRANKLRHLLAECEQKLNLGVEQYAELPEVPQSLSLMDMDRVLPALKWFGIGLLLIPVLLIVLFLVSMLLYLIFLIPVHAWHKPFTSEEAMNIFFTRMIRYCSFVPAVLSLLNLLRVMVSNGFKMAKNAGRSSDFEQRQEEHQRATAEAMGDARLRKAAEDKRLHLEISGLESERDVVAGRLEDLRHLQVVREVPALPLP